MRTLAGLLALLALGACTPDPAPAPARLEAREPPPELPAAPAEVPLQAPREVTFGASDGARIAGTLHGPARAGDPIVILVHQLGSTRAEWEPLLARLHASPAIATLAIDMRGHGASTVGPEGRTLEWRTLTNEEWAQTAEDVLGAVAYLGSPESGVQPGRIAVIGASIGSSAAIAAAAREPRIDTVVAISPGRAYHGLDAITPALALADRRFLALVAEQEIDSVETARAMARITSSEAVIVPGEVHGVRILDDTAQMDRVETFVRTSLERTRAE